MAKQSSTTGTATPPDSSQIGPELTTTLASADSTAAQRLQDLRRVHQARLSQLSRTAAALKAQYGVDDPEVKSAEAAAAAANVTAARVGMVQQQVTTPEPQAAPNGWALHGRVFDAQLAPVSGFTVFLVDGNKTFQQNYGFAYTDKTGYFLLNYSPKDSASQDKSPTAAPSAQAATPPESFVEVANTKGQPVYLSATAFQPVVGGAVYQNITLPSGDQSIGAPPAQVRKVAIPKGKKSAG
jgi:hypothetical protein